MLPTCHIKDLGQDNEIGVHEAFYKLPKQRFGAIAMMRLKYSQDFFARIKFFCSFDCASNSSRVMRVIRDDRFAIKLSHDLKPPPDASKIFQRCLDMFKINTKLH